MGLFDFLISILLAIGGAALCGYFLWVVLRNLINMFRTVKYSPNKTKPNKSLKKADLHIQNNDYKAALNILESALIVRARVSRANTKAASEHNQAVLSRILVVAEHTGADIDLLPALEKLLLEREEQQLNYVQAYETFRGIKNKRREKGKEMPSWGITEHKNKLKLIEKTLQENEKELKAILKRFFGELKSHKRNDVTYH